MRYAVAVVVAILASWVLAWVLLQVGVRFQGWQVLLLTTVAVAAAVRSVRARRRAPAEG